MNKLQGEVRPLPKMSGYVGAKTVNIGESGATFIPFVSVDGIISWTNDKELQNPDPVNIKGDKGEKGDKGDQGERGQRGIQGIRGERGEQGLKGDKGDRGEQGSQGVPGVKGETGARGADGKDGKTPEKGVDYFTNDDKAEMVEETKNAVLQLVLEPSYINTDIRIADKGLTYIRGIRAVKIIGSILWVVDSGVYNITDDFKTAANHTVYEFTLPKEISNLIPNVNGAYGTTGTLGYFPALAYENTTYTTFNCQSYLKRSAVGETEDTFQIVYTGLNAIKAGSGLCGFHLRMPVLLV